MTEEQKMGPRALAEGLRAIREEAIRCKTPQLRLQLSPAALRVLAMAAEHMDLEDDSEAGFGL